MKRPRKKPKRPPRPREKVLIVMHSGGLVEIFADSHIDIHAVNRLDLDRDETPEVANLIDAYHEAVMPRCYRELYWPNKLRHVALHEKNTPEAALDAIFALSILRGIRAEREARRPAPAAIVREKRRAAK